MRLRENFNVVDIINKQLSPRIKINHFMENQGFVYVSCDFGVQFNLQTLLLVILTSLVIMELRS
jgi:hypothetical protein